jgi:CRP/FNR family cyclic AMP-dependent transcriptional regulator
LTDRPSPPLLTDRLLELAETVTLSDGDVLFEQGDTGEALYRIVEGDVEISVLSSEGRKLTLDIMRPGAILGEIALFDPGPRTATVTALGPVRLQRIRNSDLQRELARSPELAVDLVRLAGRRMRWMNGQITEQVFLPMPVRLARRLLYLTEGRDGTLSMSQAEVAEFTGATREAVSRVLGEWKAVGMVELIRGGLRVTDRAGLQALAETDEF